MNIGADELFVICLHSSENKLEKLIENNLDLFVNTILNCIFIRFRLISQPKDKLISNNGQLFNTIRPQWLLLKASSYLSIEHSNATS